MSERNIFSEREHWLEEEYFRKQDQLLIEQIHQHKAKEEDRQQLAECTGLKDEDAITALQDLGYTSDTVELLHMLPMVEVAWAGGKVTDEHRKVILKIARMRGIQPNSASAEKLLCWLDEKPSDELFEASLHAIRLILESLPPEEQEYQREDLLARCNQIAHALFGRFWGHEIIHDEEQMIAHITEELGWTKSRTH